MLFRNFLSDRNFRSQKSTFFSSSPRLLNLTLKRHFLNLHENKKPSLRAVKRVCTRSGNRTRTRFRANRILSPACLPVPPSEQMILNLKPFLVGKGLSERRDSNSRPRPWQGRALPTELLSLLLFVNYCSFLVMQI
ncbi:MAG: hypothetical protein JWN56_1563 [Sphingobacteriales bacterium]|nr:hypothetical protein [Sphingobacteriales bacterium]